ENNKIYSTTFEAAAKYNLERMVFISSSMVFESATTFPSKESDISIIPPPVSSYGFSKLIGEQYCKAFWEQYELPYTICRPFNAYGVNEFPGDEVGYAHVIPDLIKKIFDGQYPIELLGNGQQVRCFTHISDLAEGIISTIDNKNTINEDFNIADPRPIKMIDLAELLWNLTKQKQPFNPKFISGFSYDIKKRIPDVSKIKKTTKWKAKIGLETGLKDVIEWIQNTYE
ncbi:MAG TPA: NAD-dependent epimerase/dehydratase family protein, partial [Nitrosopumilaceae archaeon]|nr:NAD-dependent epimerase/dehydratase family protein [Nitrosopumilaceae archaeon]